MIKNISVEPFYLSFCLSFLTSVFLLFFSLPFSWWLVRTKKFFLKRFFETIIYMPLVLPPTILGFYLLYIFSPNFFFGKLWFYLFGYNFSFSFYGILFASFFYSLPFSIQSIQISFEKIDNSLLEQSYILQYSKIRTFFFVILPLCKSGILKSIILTFAHTFGEFGVILMVGGNVYGKTQVLSIAIYESVEMLDYGKTHIMSFITLLISIIILNIFFFLNDKGKVF